jgi:hypothetical protein
VPPGANGTAILIVLCGSAASVRSGASAHNRALAASANIKTDARLALHDIRSSAPPKAKFSQGDRGRPAQQQRSSEHDCGLDESRESRLKYGVMQLKDEEIVHEHDGKHAMYLLTGSPSAIVPRSSGSSRRGS